MGDGVTGGDEVALLAVRCHHILSLDQGIVQDLCLSLLVQAAVPEAAVRHVHARLEYLRGGLQLHALDHIAVMICPD